MKAARFDGFYYDGRYFEAAWDDDAVHWFCHMGCDTPLEVSMARLWREKLGTILITCPNCQAPWAIEIQSLNRPLAAEIIEVSPKPHKQPPLFPH